MTLSRSLLFATAILALGCEPVLQDPDGEVPDVEEGDDVTACIQEYSVGNGYDHESDNRRQVEDVDDQCESRGGSDCDAAAYITRDAAECIAAWAGLPDGIGRWTVSVYFHIEFGVPAWDVSAMTWDDGWGWGGEVAVLHAATGEVLDTQEWEDEEDEPVG